MNSATATYNLDTSVVNLEVTIKATPQPGWDLEQGEVKKATWAQATRAMSFLVHELESLHQDLRIFIEVELAADDSDTDDPATN
jgi:hypothetical protein